MKETYKKYEKSLIDPTYSKIFPQRDMVQACEAPFTCSRRPTGFSKWRALVASALNFSVLHGFGCKDSGVMGEGEGEIDCWERCRMCGNGNEREKVGARARGMSRGRA